MSGVEYFVVNAAMSSVTGPHAIDGTANSPPKLAAGNVRGSNAGCYVTWSNVSGDPEGNTFIARVSNTGTIHFTREIVDTTIASKPGVFPGVGGPSGYTFPVLQWLYFYDESGGQAFMVLVEIPDADSDGIIPQGHVMQGRVHNANHVPSSFPATPRGWAVAFTRLSQAINSGASITEIALYTGEIDSHRRYLPATINGALYLGGGTPLIWDGLQIAELGFYYAPPVKAANFTRNTTGGSMAQGIYFYRWIYEWTDAYGQRHQSPASPTLTVDMSDAAYASGTNSVTWINPPYHLTRRGQEHVGQAGQGNVTMVGYRSTAGGVLLHRLNNYGISKQDINNIIYIDGEADSTISTNEILREQRGFVPPISPPPSTALVAHQGRLCGTDPDNPEAVWISQLYEPGTPPAWTEGQRALVSGSERIHGLASLDGKLYALAKNGAHIAMYGDGPDNAGGGQPLPTPIRVSSEYGCDSPESVAVGPDGIYFSGPYRGSRGIFLFPRGDGRIQPIGKSVRDILESNPFVNGAVYNQEKGRMEFAIGDPEDSASNAGTVLYYHHDFRDSTGEGMWTRAGTSFEILKSITLWNGRMAGVAADGEAWYRQIKNSYTVEACIAAWITGDIRLGMLKNWQWNGITLLGEWLGAVSVQLAASYDGGKTYPDFVTMAFTTETTGDLITELWEPPTKKLDRGSVRLKCTINTAATKTKQIAWSGLTIEPMPLHGVVRQPDARRA